AKRIDQHPPGEVCAGCSLSSSPDGSLVASASEVGAVELWAGANGARVATLDLRVDRVAKRTVFDAARRRLAVPVGNEVQIWNLDTRQRIATMRGHQSDVTEVAFSHDGARIVSASADGSARIWDTATGEALSVLPGLEAVANATFSDNDAQLVLAAGRSTEVWDASADLHVRSLDLGQYLMSIALAEGRVAACGSEGRVTIWRDSERAIWDTTHPCVAVALSPTGATLATAGADGTTRLWHAGTGEPIATLVSNKTGVQGVAFAPDERRLLSGDNDRVARVWDLTTGTVERTLAGHTDQMTSVAWSPDGTLLATCNRDETVRVWDRSGSDTRVLNLGGRCYSVAFDGDGSRLLAAGRDSVRIWRTGDPKHVIELEGRHDNATGVFVGTDLVLTSSRDRSARLWDATTGRLLDVWDHPGIVESVQARSGDLATGYGNHLILWRLPRAADPTSARRIASELPLELRDGVPTRRSISN
ncbi:MAG TPA: hypothetical protein VIU61_05860, partial [Kofleriaceae bacterium]